MSPTARAALALAGLAVLALLVPVPITIALFAVLILLVVVDARAAHRPLVLHGVAPRVVARGVPSALEVRADGEGLERVRIRQATAPDIVVDPAVAGGALESRLVAGRRGGHELPAPAARRTGPLGLAAWTFSGGEAQALVAYPDLPAARRLVISLRRGRFREPGHRTRGPLGLGTDFESVRDYLPDDDVRQINWLATSRVGRPMSNQYRVEQDRDVVCVVDAGRLMAAPIGPLTRLDAAVDAVAAVALVADEVGDRSGVIVFDDEIRRRVKPLRNGGRAVVQAVVDVEPQLIDSDYDLAFRSVGASKRGLVIVFTDLVDEAAARSLLAAVPVLARRHAVVVASVTDPDLHDAMVREPATTRDVYATAVARDVLEARTRVAARLRGCGAVVLEASPARLGEACVGAYLRLKARARL
ncbi:MAG: DUF58 domain-containing protein [Acidimicrobiia bacterium]